MFDYFVFLSYFCFFFSLYCYF
jgi:hypothetical protein